MAGRWGSWTVAGVGTQIPVERGRGGGGGAVWGDVCGGGEWEGGLGGGGERDETGLKTF